MRIKDIARALGLSFALAAQVGALGFLIFLASGFSFAILFGGQTEYLQPFNEMNQIIAGVEICLTLFSILVVLWDLTRVVERLRR